MKVYFESLIDDLLWDDAGWSGVTWFSQPDAPPTLGIVFGDDWWARHIFAAWHRRLGYTDRYEELRISIVEDGRPPEYRIRIGSDPYNSAMRTLAEGHELEVDTSIPLSRTHLLSRPPDLARFKRFKQAYSVYQQYQIVPVINGNVPLFHISLAKRQLNFIG